MEGDENFYRRQLLYTHTRREFTPSPTGERGPPQVLLMQDTRAAVAHRNASGA